MAILWQEVSVLTKPGRIFLKALDLAPARSYIVVKTLMKLLRDEKKRKWQDKERYRPQGPKQEFWSLESSWRRERVPVLAERKFNKLIHSKIWFSNNISTDSQTETSKIFQDRLRKY